MASGATYPNTYTANNLLYASSTTAVTGLSTANSSVLVTNGSGVPSLSTTLPNIAIGTPTSGTLTNCTGLPVAGGGTGVSSLTTYAVICGGTTTTGAVQSIASVGTSGQVLTSNGAGALPTFQAGGGVGRVINIQTFKASGTYTPTAGMTNCFIQCVAGGGAGGGTATTAYNAGGGGGAGSYSQSYVAAATIGASQTVTIGAGGTGGSNANGNNGNDTSVGSIVIAKAGSGALKGVSLSAVAGAAGGVAGTGDLTLTGGAGGNGIPIAAGTSSGI